MPSINAGPAVAWPDAQRHTAFERWLMPLAQTFQLDAASLAPASADASFRRYLRIASPTRTFIVMDAPPPQEDVRPFVDIAARIKAAGLHAPAMSTNGRTSSCGGGASITMNVRVGDAIRR